MTRDLADSASFTCSMSWTRSEDRVLTFLFINLRIVRDSSQETLLGSLDAKLLFVVFALFAFACFKKMVVSTCTGIPLKLIGGEKVRCNDSGCNQKTR